MKSGTAVYVTHMRTLTSGYISLARNSYKRGKGCLRIAYGHVTDMDPMRSVWYYVTWFDLWWHDLSYRDMTWSIMTWSDLRRNDLIYGDMIWIDFFVYIPLYSDRETFYSVFCVSHKKRQPKWLGLHNVRVIKKRKLLNWRTVLR